MITSQAWIILVFLLVAGLLLYWLLVITEGTYLGQNVVTWLYDITAHRYDAIKGFDSEMEAMFIGRPLAAALRPEPAPLVLDIGTGTGRLPLTLLEQPTFQGRIVGIDHSNRMLQLAAQKLHAHKGRVWLIQRNSMSLPFPDSVFDAVTCLEMLEFTPAPAALLVEAVRVLRPGGILVTTRRSGFDANLFPGKTHSKEDFASLLEALDLTDIRVRPWQVDYDLAWGLRRGSSPRGPRLPIEVLLCPLCKAQEMVETGTELVCQHCKSCFPIRYGIIEMNV